MGWIDDVGAKGQDYALTGTFLWIGIMLGEPIVSDNHHYIPVDLNKASSLTHSGESTSSETAPRQVACWMYVRMDRCKLPSLPTKRIL